MDEAHRYEICVEGHLTQRWAAWFEGMAIYNLPCGDTALRGTIVDQAALYGLLNKVQGLNLKLISVNRLSSRKQDQTTQ